jgi:hypothetical protein
MINVYETVEDEGKVTELTPRKLFPDHLEPAVGKRQAALDWPINLLVGRSP